MEDKDTLFDKIDNVFSNKFSFNRGGCTKPLPELAVPRQTRPNRMESRHSGAQRHQIRRKNITKRKT